MPQSIFDINRKPVQRDPRNPYFVAPLVPNVPKIAGAAMQGLTDSAPVNPPALPPRPDVTQAFPPTSRPQSVVPQVNNPSGSVFDSQDSAASTAGPLSTMPASIKGLQTAGGSSKPQTPNLGDMQANDPITLSSLRDNRKGQLEDYLASGPDYRASELLKTLGGDISNDPYTGDAAQANQAGIEQRRQAAIEQGYGGGSVQGRNYGDPVQEANAAARAQEQYKVDAPVRAQQAAGQAEIEKQRVANEGAMGVAGTKAEQAQNFLDMLRDMPQNNGMSGVTIPGGGHASFNRPSTVPSALASEVTKARMNYEQAVQKGEAGGIKVAQSALDQSIQMALSREPAAPAVKALVTHMLFNPEYAGKSLDQVLQEKGEADNITPEEYQQAQELLGRYQGS